MKSLLNIEEHPLEPFLPVNAKLLMLGSFPPQKKRWSMEFFYPNLQNDMWRIFGIIFFQNKDHFLNPDKKVFDKERIIDLLNKKGIALYDTASAVRRLQDNASDKFLEVVEQTDISLLLKQIPMCKAIVTTGQLDSYANLMIRIVNMLHTKNSINIAIFIRKPPCIVGLCVLMHV